MICMNAKKRRYYIIFFVVYIIISIWIIIFKFTVNFREPEFLISRGINLIPFNNYREGLGIIPLLRIWSGRLLYAAILIPSGIFVSVLISKPNVFIKALIASLLSFSFEIIQWIFQIGISDITDYLMGFLGSLIGVIIFEMIRKKKKEHVIDRINDIGMIIFDLGAIMVSLIVFLNFSKVYGIIMIGCTLLANTAYIIDNYIMKRIERS